MKLQFLSAVLVFAGMVANGSALAGKAPDPSATPSNQPPSVTSSKGQIRLTRVTPEYWRVTFHNPPYNIFGPGTIPQLNEVVTAIETDPNVKVVVFDSDVPNVFLTHYDFAPPLTDTINMPNGPTGLPPIPDLLVRISRAPVVSISLIRGRATGVGSELALASDMRFASREKTLLSQFEIGAGFTPGGGPMARLPRMIGRGRALEVLVTGSNINGDLAERYGYVNRALPDAELDQFVDTMARRIASFDKQTLADIKKRVDVASLPPDAEFHAEWDAFVTSVKRPPAQQRVGKLMELGLQENAAVEEHLNDYTATLGKSPK
jgi:enoyl-CoA hydratase/carnithine racemase